MSGGKHTAKRWAVGRRRSGRVALVTESGESFAGFYDFDGPEVRRRAKVAAAAPDLLAACEAALPWVEVEEANHRGAADVATQLRAAIKKARGT